MKTTVSMLVAAMHVVFYNLDNPWVLTTLIGPLVYFNFDRGPTVKAYVPLRTANCSRIKLEVLMSFAHLPKHN